MKIWILAAAFLVQASTGDQAKLERVRRLTPEERARLTERLEQLKKLPPDEKRRLTENLDRIRSMPAGEVQNLKEKVKRLSPEERAADRGLASGFFKWAARRKLLEGFPRGLFFTWLKKEKPEEIGRIRAMEPGVPDPRVDAFIKLYAEFRTVALARAERHVDQHGCSSPEDVAALSDAPPEEMWPRFQQLTRQCLRKAPVEKD